MKKVLYISGSIGLGHISKDLSIVRKLRELNPSVDVTWVAAHPTDLVLDDAGEKIHPKSKQFSSYSASAENASKGSSLNLVEYVFGSLPGWYKNIRLIRQIIASEHYDLLVGNETYEIIIGLVFGLFKLNVPFVMIYDFIGLDSMTNKPFVKFGNYILNWIWSRDRRILTGKNRKALFVGELEDIPEKKLGFLLPDRRDYAKVHYEFVGYIVLFDPRVCRDQRRVRKELGYDDRSLVICTIGGTSIGKGLLELCSKTFPILKKKIPRMRMVLVSGPRLSPDSVKVEEGVEVRGFVPELYKHYAASDVAVVQGGFSSTLELTALRKPFIFFPIEGHGEQEYVAERLARYNAGTRMYLSRTTPELLAEQILHHFYREVCYRKIPTDGAMRAALAMNRFLV
ncbi:MAG: glycosyltransferase [candidate division WOR-3 bacterium]|nr:MAG: glycosyltransferase [candidate division WOR-3 bacterium]